MSYELTTEVRYEDTGNIDAFGRLRVSQITTQFDMKQLHDNLPLFIDEELIGTATNVHSTTLAKSTLTAPASGDVAILQTKQKFNYQSGKSQLIFMTFFNLGEGETVSLVTSRNGTETSRTIRDDWFDRMDGTGVSGLTHDFNENTILAYDYEWLGLGRVRWYLVKNGALHLINEVDFTNSTEVYMSSPNQPLRWECKQPSAGVYYNRVGYFSSNTTTPFASDIDGIWIESGDGTGTLDIVCSSVGTEGSQNFIGRDGGIDDDGTHLNANNTNNWYYAVGLRLQAGKTDTLIDIVSGDLLSTTNDSFIYRVLLNPTYASTVTYTDVTNYSTSYGLGGTANTISSMGTILEGGFGQATSSRSFAIDSAIRLGSLIDGTLEEIVIAVKPLTSNLDIHRSVNWRELT